MNTNELFDILHKLVIACKDILIGGVGGLVMYFVENKRLKANGVEAKIDGSQMVINMIIGSFVAYAVGSSIDMSVTYRDGILGVVGMCSYSIVGLLESRFSKWFVDVLMAVFGGGKR